MIKKIFTNRYKEKNINYTHIVKLSKLYFLKTTIITALIITVIIFIAQIKNSYTSGIYSSTFSVLFFLILLFFLIKFKNNIEIISSILLLFTTITLFLGMIYGGFKKSAIFFTFCFPLVAFFIHGSKKGLLWSINFYILYLLITLMVRLKFIESSYSAEELTSSSLALLASIILTFLFSSRQEKVESKVAKEIYCDTLTGLPNRRKLIMDIENKPKIVLCIINVDDFKEINTIFGYSIGDEALIYLKERIIKFLDPKTQNLYKLNGDEFAIITNSTDEEIKKLKELINLLNEDLQTNKFIYKNDEVILRVSAGIADRFKYPQENILSIADIALKEAKKSSFSVVEYSQNLLKNKDRYLENIISLNIISDAIENDRIFPYYQPILNNKTEKIEKYECLVRIIDSHGEIYSPTSFLDVAKKSRLYPKITRIMLKKAVERFRRTNYEFSINLSIEDFLNPYTVQFILLVLEENAEICKNINFEVIETEGVHNYTLFSQFLKSIRNFGCKIAIDDFGSGYSNFDHFIKMNADYLKIDGSLIKNIDTDNNAKIVVSNIVKFAKELNIKTIAEYVHSKSVYETVKEIGVDYSQGYYIGYPSPQIIEEI